VLRDRYIVQVQKERAGDRLSQAVNALFSSPILTVRQLEKQLEINFPAAERCVQRLVERGLLREITGKARNRIYQVDAILKALNE
jgi:ribosomal protein S25